MSLLTDASSTAPVPDGEPPPPGCRLVLVEGAHAGTTRVLAPGRHVVGRAPTADLRIDDARLSRFHFELTVDALGLTVTDLASANGIIVNGAQVRQARIRPGASVVAGGLRFVVLPPTDEAPLPDLDRLGGLVGRSLPMRRLYEQLIRVAQTDTTLLVTGESGTGKEVCAATIHELSSRRGAPFVVCDLTTLSGPVMESELFGHERGAFTGAVAPHTGLLRSAAGGTVLLDEIGELPREAQSKLLRFVERREIRAVGAHEPTPLDLRLIAATLRPLGDLVASGQFRLDLMHRLAVITVAVPPLRDRIDDLGLLARELLARHAPGASWQLTEDALALLAAYPWPGNVRELRNLLARVVAQAEAPVIDIQTLVHCGGIDPPRTPVEPGPVPFSLAKEIVTDRWERAYLQDLLDRCKGSPSRAAQVAGVARGHLYRLLTKHRIEPR